MKRTLLWLAIIMISFPWFTNFRAEDQLSASDERTEQHAQSTRLFITGTLVNVNGSPRPNEELWAFGNRLGRIKVGKKGRLLNPTTKTDEKGRFRLEFDRKLFGTEDIIIGVMYTPPGAYSSFAALQNDKGIPVSLKIDPKVTNVSLGKIKVSTRQ
jgi:hypothetical protein